MKSWFYRISLELLIISVLVFFVAAFKFMVSLGLNNGDLWFLLLSTLAVCVFGWLFYIAWENEKFINRDPEMGD